MHLQDNESTTDLRFSNAIPIVGRQSNRHSPASTAVSSVTASFSSSLGQEVNYRRSLTHRATSVSSLSNNNNKQSSLGHSTSVDSCGHSSMTNTAASTSPKSIVQKRTNPSTKVRPASLVVVGSNGIGIGGGIGGVSLVRQSSSSTTGQSAAASTNTTARVVTSATGQIDPISLEMLQSDRTSSHQRRGSLRSLLTNAAASTSSTSLVAATTAEVTVTATTATASAALATPVINQSNEQSHHDIESSRSQSMATRELSVVAAQLAANSTSNDHSTNSDNEAVAEAALQTAEAITYRDTYNTDRQLSSSMKRQQSVGTQTSPTDVTAPPSLESDKQKSTTSGGWWFYRSSGASTSTPCLPTTSTTITTTTEVNSHSSSHTMSTSQDDSMIKDTRHPKGLQREKSATMPISSSTMLDKPKDESKLNTSDTAARPTRRSWWFYGGGGDYDTTDAQEDTHAPVTESVSTQTLEDSKDTESIKAIDTTKQMDYSHEHSESTAASNKRSSWWFGYYTNTEDDDNNTVAPVETVETVKTVETTSIHADTNSSYKNHSMVDSSLHDDNAIDTAASSGSWWPFSYWQQPDTITTITEEPYEGESGSTPAVDSNQVKQDQSDIARSDTSAQPFITSNTSNGTSNNGNGNDDGNDGNSKHHPSARSSWFFTWRTAPETSTVEESSNDTTMINDNDSDNVHQETMSSNNEDNSANTIEDHSTSRSQPGYLWSWWHGTDGNTAAQQQTESTTTTTTMVEQKKTEKPSSNESPLTTDKVEGVESKTTTRTKYNNDSSVNPLISTMPATRSAWSYFFRSSAVASAQAQHLVKDKAHVSTDALIDDQSSNTDTIVASVTNDTTKSPATTPKKKKKTTDNSKDTVAITTTNTTTTTTITNTAEEERGRQHSRRNSVASTKSRPSSLTGRHTRSTTGQFESISTNFVLPAFESDLARRSNQASGGIVAQAVEMVSSYLFPSRQTVRPRVNKVAIIGVHGWAPVKLIQRMFGEPTGTSEKFCEQMEKAVRQFLYETHQVQLPADAITLMPLNGEGKVQNRVEKLYSILMSPERALWRKALSEADCVFVTTHSQGTPVSTMLLARLLREGIVRTHRQRVCMLAMAGISHGPFPFLKDNLVVRYVEADAARELFHFMDADREVTTRYRNDMHTVLKQGVKVVCVGSMADQVVPLYSGIMHGFSHPSLLRAIYIDGVDYTGDFLTSLITFALRLRNHGIHDHGLIVYLSEAIAGSLYSGTQGHSTIYEELQVYVLAVRWLFDAHPEPLRGGQPVEHPADPVLTPFQADERLNPYYLPWIMRGLLEDKRLRKNTALLRDVELLQRQFEQWDPISRPMKELKFRLEPLRARL